VDTSLEVLDNKRSNAKVIASSKEIKDDDDNPPHYPARQQYVKKVTAANFLSTATNEKIGKAPQPIVFEITSQGPVPPKKVEGTAKAVGTAAASSVTQPSTYGSETF